MMEALTLIADGEESVGEDSHSVKLLKCFLDNKIDSTEGVRIVGRYILRTPDVSSTPMVAVVIKAFNDTCAAYLK